LVDYRYAAEAYNMTVEETAKQLSEYITNMVKKAQDDTLAQVATAMGMPVTALRLKIGATVDTVAAVTVAVDTPKRAEADGAKRTMYKICGTADEVDRRARRIKLNDMSISILKAVLKLGRETGLANKEETLIYVKNNPDLFEAFKTRRDFREGVRRHEQALFRNGLLESTAAATPTVATVTAKDTGKRSGPDGKCSGPDGKRSGPDGKRSGPDGKRKDKDSEPEDKPDKDADLAYGPLWVHMGQMYRKHPKTQAVHRLAKPATKDKPAVWNLYGKYIVNLDRIDLTYVGDIGDDPTDISDSESEAETDSESEVEEAETESESEVESETESESDAESEASVHSDTDSDASSVTASEDSD
jgi:hypothetical protein